MRSVFLATICIGLAATARAQQTPSQEPLPANPVPVMAEDESLLPEEIMLVPQLPPPRAGETPGKLPPYKLKLEAVEIEPLLRRWPLALPTPGTLASALRVHVKRFRFEGNTVFSDRELAKVVARFAGREISSAELEEARQALSLYYVEHGYINSGALLPIRICRMASSPFRSWKAG
jgi:hemolysin activation/secretion protein